MLGLRGEVGFDLGRSVLAGRTAKIAASEATANLLAQPFCCLPLRLAHRAGNRFARAQAQQQPHFEWAALAFEDVDAKRFNERGK